MDAADDGEADTAAPMLPPMLVAVLLRPHGVQLPQPPPHTASGGNREMTDNTTKRLWCRTCEHVHIATIPHVTYQCLACGFGGWQIATAAAHQVNLGGNHVAFAVVHDLAALDAAGGHQ